MQHFICNVSAMCSLRHSKNFTQLSSIKIFSNTIAVTLLNHVSKSQNILHWSWAKLVAYQSPTPRPSSSWLVMLRGQKAKQGTARQGEKWWVTYSPGQADTEAMKPVQNPKSV